MAPAAVIMEGAIRKSGYGITYHIWHPRSSACERFGECLTGVQCSTIEYIYPCLHNGRRENGTLEVTSAKAKASCTPASTCCAACHCNFEIVNLAQDSHPRSLLLIVRGSRKLIVGGQSIVGRVYTNVGSAMSIAPPRGQKRGPTVLVWLVYAGIRQPRLLTSPICRSPMPAKSNP